MIMYGKGYAEVCTFDFLGQNLLIYAIKTIDI